ncbi:cytochrome P450 84A1-like [Prosopis cineraria]|uniref:cytochrome P450 84A1-like n=1 Tax=Prosopis cineraria TaxID=364024 RepID=UPI00240F0E29|nr:cytochrome P450 84A1-like [Prosopis cineraria]
MEISLQLSAILFLILTSFVCLLFLRQLRRKLPYPPSPHGLPVIGNMLMLHQLTHRGLARLAKKYGGLFHLRMGIVHIVVVSSADMAHEVLQAQDNVFSNRPASLAISYLTYGRADMAFANYGPFWRQMRKICTMKLFSRNRTETWASVREEVDRTVQNIMEKTGSPINLGDLVFDLTRSITFKAAFGTSLNEEQEEFMKILQEFSKLFGAFNIGDFIPWLGWLHSRQFKKRMVEARNALDVFIDKIIDEHVAKRNNSEERDYNDSERVTDMVDELMAFLNEGGGGDNTELKNSHQPTLKLTRDNIKALIMDVMFGGTETVASAIEWAIAELLKSPMDLQKVQQELEDVVGPDRRFKETDLDKLTYLTCVIKETLRLHPPIPLLLHQAAEDAVVAGYFIPANSRVWINAWAIGRDERAWDEPEMFKPWRFLNDESPDFRGSNFEFIPFGSGRRSCPGMQLGLYALEMTVAELLHCFEWELGKGMKPSEVDMSDVIGLTAPKAVRLVAVPSYRLNVPLKDE